jgi:phage tail-like protein
MAITQALASLSRYELKVEAGATDETIIGIRSAAEAWPEGFPDYAVRVRGLPDGWYSLSRERVRVPVGEWAEVLLVIHPPSDDPKAPLGEYEFTVELAPLPEGTSIALAGRLLALAPGGLTLRSSLLDYLPNIYRSDYFLGRFLLIFQSILDPIEATANNTHHYLDPSLTPAHFLPWLAFWVGIDLEPGMDEAAQRELIRRAVELSRWKGTRRALREELRIRTGGRALIVENFDGMRLGQDASLGLNTHLGVRRDHCIATTLAVDDLAAVDQRQVDAIVEELKPAHVGHVVRLVAAPSKT